MTQDTTELIASLRSFETDHAPDGWPAIRMRDITALIDALENARSDNQVLRLGYTAARLEIESLRADKARIDWLAAPENGIGNVQLPAACVHANLHSLRGAIDMAMGAKQ